MEFMTLYAAIIEQPDNYSPRPITNIHTDYTVHVTLKGILTPQNDISTKNLTSAKNLVPFHKRSILNYPTSTKLLLVLKTAKTHFV